MKHWKFGLAFVLAVVDVYLLTHQWSAVAGNLYAQVIISTPQVLGMYELLKRRADRHQAAVHARLDAQDEALAETHRKVREMHEAQTTGRLPKRLYRPDSGDPPRPE